MKKIFALLAISLIPCFASASIITLDFTASGFDVFDPGVTPPQESVSGRIIYQANSINSDIQKLLSIDLTIAGYTYQLSDIDFSNAYGMVYSVGANPGVSGATGGTNDFWLVWGDSIFQPGQWSQPLYYTTNNSDVAALSFLYTSEESGNGWTPQTLALSFKESTVSEPSSLILMALALFGLILRRKA